MGDDFVDHYHALGLSELAANGPVGKDAVSKAFRKLALRFHPDKLARQNLSEQAREEAKKRFDEINVANQVLQDDSKRAEFEVEYQKKRERERRAKEQDAATRRMVEELAARERSAELAKMAKRRESAASQFNLGHIRQKDAAYKKRMYNNFFQAESSTSTAAEKNAASKEDRYFANFWETKGDSILDTVISEGG